MTNPNEPAFPQGTRERVFEYGQESWVNTLRGGLTKREEIAKAIMAGYAASSDPQTVQANPKERAIWALNDADALIDELSK